MAKTRKKPDYYPDFQYGERIDEIGPELLKTPKEFDFSKCLNFLARSPLEPGHKVQNNSLYKLEKFDGQMVLMKIGGCRDQSIGIEFLTPRPVKSVRTEVSRYVRHWFDLDTDLRPFYRMAGHDSVLNKVTADLYGLRILKIPDLFEAISWAIIGQQINLRFAYMLKKRFVESFGEEFTFRRQHYYLFPTPQKIAALKISDMKGLQFTARKSEYIIELAQKMNNGELTREGLLRHKNFNAARNDLLRIRGTSPTQKF